MTVREKIALRRRELKLTHEDVKKIFGSDYDYDWLEMVESHIYDGPTLQYLKKVVSVYGFEPFDLFNLRCAFCDEDTQYLDIYKLPRNEMLRFLRIDLGLTLDEMGDKIGFATNAVEGMEADEDYMDRTWDWETIQMIIDNLYEETKVKLPLQVMLGIKCPICGR